MKIGVVSDTHIRTDDELDAFKSIFSSCFSDVDLLLHAGDLISLKVFEWLSSQVETVAVSGNMDFAEVSEILPKSRVVEVGKFKVGVTHGWGPPDGLTRRVKKSFEKSDGELEVDCIVFGHSHSALNELGDSVLLFNPGAPMDKRFAAYNSVGFLEINKEIKGRIERI